MPAAVTLVDDAGARIRLDTPASRIISLAPHLTELVYAAGAGKKLIAVTEYSNFPEAAKILPRVGSSSAIDLEKMVSLKPDLVLVWKSGTPLAHQLRLRQLGIPVAVFELQHLEDIGNALDRIGQLAGTTVLAQKTKTRFVARLAKLQKQYSQLQPVSVFYQIWGQPIMSVNRRHMINDVIRLCGGRNIFAELKPLAPVVDVESVISKAPQVIIASAAGGVRPQWLADWRQWKNIPAVRDDNLFYIDSDLIARSGPRALLGAEILCRDLDSVRRSKLKNTG